MNPHIVPAGQPPPDVYSNFVDPVNNAPNLVACNIVLLIISTFLVAARLISRTYLTDWRLGWDDYSMIVALVGTAIFSSFVITTTNYGLGRHMWDVPISTYTPQYLWWIMATFAACPASYYFVKISILFFYLRVFQLQAKLRYIIYALFAYCTIYYWVAFATVIGLCNVKNRTWDITVTMNCFAYGELTFAIGSLDLIADALILAFPVPMVVKLRISWPQRIYLLFVFLAGIMWVLIFFAGKGDLMLIFFQSISSLRHPYRFGCTSSRDNRCNNGTIPGRDLIVSLHDASTLGDF